MNIYFNCSSVEVGSREACGVPFSCCKRQPNELIKNKQCGYDVRKPDYVSTKLRCACLRLVTNWKTDRPHEMHVQPLTCVNTYWWSPIFDFHFINTTFAWNAFPLIPFLLFEQFFNISKSTSLFWLTSENLNEKQKTKQRKPSPIWTNIGVGCFWVVSLLRMCIGI